MAEESNSSSSNDTLLEEAFRLIQSGNEAEDHADRWKAADCFSQAHTLLSQLSASAASGDPNSNIKTAQSSSKSSSKEEDEQQQRKKIVQLYQQQSIAYLKRGRQSLVRALEEDTAADEKDGAVAASASATSSPSTDHAANTTTSSQLLHTLTDDEVEFRLRVFGRLFAREMQSADHHEEDLIHAQESSLEARLAQLSQSLPAAAKNERERVRDLNRGLARLGLPQVGDASEQAHTGRLFGLRDNPAPKSDSEQVADIIAQAKDEVAVSGGGAVSEEGNDAALAAAAAAGDLGPDAAAKFLLDSSDADDDSLDDEDDVSLDEEDDAVLTPEMCRDLQTKLVAAQVNLSELVALFDVDQDDEAEIEFDQARGKKVLKDARLLLRQVAQQWADAS